MSILKRLVDLLAPLGFLLAVGALAWTPLRQDAARRPAAVADRRPRPRAPAPRPALGRRGARSRPPPAQVRDEHPRPRRWSCSASSAASNYLVARHTKRFDLTKDQRYSLSDQTRKVVAGLKEDVKITYFQRQRDMARGAGPAEGVPGALAAAQGRLRRPGAEPGQGPGLRRARPVADPRRREGRQARARLERRRAGHHERAHQGHPRGQEDGLPRSRARASAPARRAASAASPAPRASLTKSLYEVKNVFLLREKKVPADCTVLVVGGPEKDLLPETTAAIRDYVKEGGKAFVMVEPELKEALPEPRRAAQGLEHRGRERRGGRRLGDGPALRLSELAPLAIDYP